MRVFTVIILRAEKGIGRYLKDNILDELNVLTNGGVPKLLYWFISAHTVGVLAFFLGPYRIASFFFC